MLVKKVVVDKANRLFQLQPDIFAFAKEKSKPSLVKKYELLDLGRFQWSVSMSGFEPPQADQLLRAPEKKISLLKENLADWFQANHNARLNPKDEIYIGGGISSTVFSLALAFIASGDIVFVPELGVPLYRKVTVACGGEPVGYAINHKNSWLPDWERLHTRLGRSARLLFLNSPHNPTGAVLNERELENLAWTAGRENIVVVNDAAYQSLGDRPAPSLMTIAGGRKVGLEVYSFAYLFGLPAVPFGFAVGNKELIGGLEHARTINNQFVPEFYVDIALQAIRHYPSTHLTQLKKQLSATSSEALTFLDYFGVEKTSHDTIPFLWGKLRGRRSSLTFVNQLYRRTRILIAPGVAFGDTGEGYLRLSLTQSADAYRAALDRIKRRLSLVKPKGAGK